MKACRALVPSLAILAIIAILAACGGPIPDAGEGEGEPCVNGRLRSTAWADVDVDTCLTTRSLSDDGRELSFSLDETFALRINSNVELDPLPLVLEDENSSTIASYDDGEHLWRVSDGLILGVPVGDAVTTLDSVDDDGAHGVFDGAAFDNDLADEVADPMTVRVDF